MTSVRHHRVSVRFRNQIYALSFATRMCHRVSHCWVIICCTYIIWHGNQWINCTNFSSSSTTDHLAHLTWRPWPSWGKRVERSQKRGLRELMHHRENIAI